MRASRGWVAFAAAAVLAGCAAPSGTPGDEGPSASPSPGPVAPLETFDFSGGQCAELALTLRVDGARARAFVPARYRLVGEEAGSAWLSVAVAECRELRTHNATRGVYSNLGFLIHPVSGSGPPEHYLLGTSSTRQTLVDLAAGLGMPMGRLHNATIVVASPRPAATAYWAPVDHPNGTYAVSANAVNASLPFPASPTNPWWYQGTNRTVVFEYFPTVATVRSVAGFVDVAAGSDLAKAIGGTSATGPGLYSTFSFTAKARSTSSS